MSPSYRYKRGSKKKHAEKPLLPLAIGRVYVVRRYYTGDFRAKCCDSLKKSARLKVTDPMQTALQVDDELEIPFVHAEFIPAIVEEFKNRSRSGSELVTRLMAGDSDVPRSSRNLQPLNAH